MNNRLTRHAEPIYKDDPPNMLDEIVLTNAYVHLERMSRNNWMLIIENEQAHFHLNVRKVIEYEMIVGEEMLGEQQWESA